MSKRPGCEPVPHGPVWTKRSSIVTQTYPACLRLQGVRRVHTCVPFQPPASGPGAVLVLHRWKSRLYVFAGRVLCPSKPWGVGLFNMALGELCLTLGRPLATRQRRGPTETKWRISDGHSTPSSLP